MKVPKEGSRAWEKALPDSTAYARNTIASLVRRAEGGDKQAVEILLGWLRKWPEMRALVRGLDALADKVEECWVASLCGTDELAREALRGEVAATKAELLGAAPSVVDRMLAGTVVVADLAYKRAARAAALPTDQPAVRAARERRLTTAQRRLADAVKAWELVAGKKAKGARPRGKLALFDPAA